MCVGRLANPENRDAFGIIVSYAVKVKLFLGALGGEVSAELPFVLMHPKVKLYENSIENRVLLDPFYCFISQTFKYNLMNICLFN